MSTETAMVKARKLFEKFYIGKCTITEKKRVVDTITHKTTWTNVDILTDEPCRLSHTTKTTATKNDSITEIKKQITLYIAPEHNIKAGSKISITQNGRTIDFEKSGEASFYTTHQEIPLSLFKETT